jgi:opacity protein-like surface antigen
MRRRILLATAVSALLAAPASAADVDIFAPAPPGPEPVATGPLADWSGFHIGVLFGYSFGDAKTGVPLNIDVRGLDAGIYGGASYQYDRFVLGLEGDALLSGLSGSRAGLRLDQRWSGSLRGVPSCPPCPRRCIDMIWVGQARCFAREAGTTICDPDLDSTRESDALTIVHVDVR